MKKENYHGVVRSSPKSAGLEKVDVWLRSESKRRQGLIAAQDNRSANKQAAHYIQLGLGGINLEELARKIDSMEEMLTDAPSASRKSRAQKALCRGLAQRR